MRSKFGHQFNRFMIVQRNVCPKETRTLDVVASGALEENEASVSAAVYVDERLLPGVLGPKELCACRRECKVNMVLLTQRQTE